MTLTLPRARKPVLNTLAQSWLDLQCQMIPSVQRGLVIVGATNVDQVEPTARWPSTTNIPQALRDAARVALEQSQPIVQGQTEHEQSGSIYGIACPLIVDGTVFGVVAVEARGAIDQQRAVLQLLQWGTSWLEFLVQRETSAVTGRLVSLVSVIAVALEKQSFAAAAYAATTELSRVLAGCRVSLGLVENQRIRCQAISDNVQFSKRSSTVHLIEAAMEEAIDQRLLLIYPPSAQAQNSDRPRVLRAHQQLSQSPGSGTICTVPFGDERGLLGTLSIERDGDQGFDTSSIELCEAVASLVGPILYAKRVEDRWLTNKLWHSVKQFAHRLLGRDNIKLKLGAFALSAILLFAALAKGTAQVSAPANIETVVQRIVSSPRDGYLKSVQVRAGDPVRKGQLLAKLDTEDLELEQTKLANEKEQLVKEHREAFASGKRAQARILKAKLEQISAREELNEAQLARSNLSSPFDGYVIEGDIEQALGAAVTRGEELFSLAPLEAQRVRIEVDERDISRINHGMVGKLRLTAYADTALPFVIDRLAPVSVAESGKNVFHVEATLSHRTSMLRPGMRGLARIDIERQHLVAIWTHDLRHWIRMQLWRWKL